MNKKNDHLINDYLKYRKIAQLLADSVLDSDSQQEHHEELITFMSDEKNCDTIRKRLQESEKAEKIYQIIDKRNKDADIQKLTSRLSHHQHRRIYNHSMIVVSSVAAAILFLFFVIYDSSKENTPAKIVINTEQESIQAEQKPTAPILIYDKGGEKIILKNQERLSLNGNNIANVNDKKLEYIANSSDTVLFATLVIPERTKYTVVLPDGTEVYLNANSKLKYPSRFDDERCVELDGEAFFKVSKSDIPFRVKVKGVEIKVYGTEFNILAYHRERVVATLLSGSVGVKYQRSNQSIETRIKPNERITIETKIGAEKVDKNVNTAKYKSWQENYFRYDEEPLEDLLDALSNWYGVKFIYFNEEVRRKTISASLENSLNIDNILKMLELSSKVKFIKEGGKYVVK